MKRIVIIGCGNVGLEYLKKLCMIDITLDISLIDINEDRLTGEILDLEQSLVYRNSNIRIRLGNYKDCDNADIVVITAGVPQAPKDRMSDLEKANEIVVDISNRLRETSFKGIILVASNPMEVITELIAHYTDYPYNKVIGTGTMLDTARLKSLISKRINVKPNDINAYVLGEHGNSQFVAWSNANIGLENLSKFLSLDDKEDLEYETRHMGETIIKCKGYTSDGVALCLLEITLCILYDLKKVYPLSNYNTTYDVYLSTPCIIGKNGIEKVINIKLTSEEEKKLESSAVVISEAIDKILPKELY
jgi:L-2-hydroxyisocaproate dehydrogenase